MGRRRTRVVVGMIAGSMAVSACSFQQISETVSAGAKFLNDPVIQGILDKVVLPLLPLDSKQLKPLLDKTFTSAKIVELFRSTMGTDILDLPRANVLKQVGLEGTAAFGILTTTNKGLGDVGPGATLERLIKLILSLFDLKAKDSAVEPTQALPQIYANSGGGLVGSSPTPAPTAKPTSTPTATPTAAPTATPTAAPTSAPAGPVGQVDLRAKFPKVRDQGPRGTCNLHVMAALLDYYYPERGSHSPEFLDWLYNLNFRSRVSDERLNVWNVDEGTYTYVLIAMLSPQGNPFPTDDLPYIPPGQGAALESETPYNADLQSSRPDESPEAVAPRRLGTGLADKMKTGVALRTDVLQMYELKLDVATLKGALAEGNPVGIAYPCRDQDWQRSYLRSHSYNIGELPDGTSKQTARNIGYHAVTLAGYREDGSAPGGGRFLVRNSWGDDWGDSGYAWISYAMTTKFAHSPVIGKRVDGSNITTFSSKLPPKDPPKRFRF
jgi:hypothetical protein